VPLEPDAAVSVMLAPLVWISRTAGRTLHRTLDTIANSRTPERGPATDRAGALPGSTVLAVTYFDSRIVDFIALGGESARWVQDLHSEIGGDPLHRLQGGV